MTSLKHLGFKTEPHITPPVNGPEDTVHILHGAEGYVVFCLLCEKNVTPVDPYGRHLRASYHAAAYDRFNHYARHKQAGGPL